MIKFIIDIIKLVWRWLRQTTTPTPEPLPITPVPPYTPTPISTPEEQIIALVNNERTKRGLNALKLNDKMMESATNYASLMAKMNILSHNLNGNIGNRLERVGYIWNYAGENIGYNYNTPEEMVLGWMQSLGHRANILNSNYIDTGVGVKDEGKGPYYCQHFAGI